MSFWFEKVFFIPNPVKISSNFIEDFIEGFCQIFTEVYGLCLLILWAFYVFQRTALIKDLRNLVIWKNQER